MAFASRAVLLLSAFLFLGVGMAAQVPVVSIPKAGQMNALGILVDAHLEAAHKAYVAGDADAALAALGEPESRDTQRAWFKRLFLAEVLIQMGRTSEALGVLEQSAKQEVQLFGTSLLSQAVQGEAWVKLQDYEQAHENFRRVETALKNWSLPEDYREPPNVTWLAHRSHAQARAHSGLAVVALHNHQFDLAIMQANKAEAVYSSMEALAAHEQYRQYFKLHFQTVVGRANNLTVLGASTAIQHSETPIALTSFQQADQLYLAANYAPGQASSLALQAYAAYETRRYATAIQTGEQSVAIANALNLPDLMWRVQLLLGKAYLKSERLEQAEQAFRRSQAAVDLVNGSLASDRSKQLFGVGKAEISAHLMDFNLAHKNLAQLFEDAERGRARAFVDLLTDTELSLTDDLVTNTRVRNLDERIRMLRLQHSLHNDSRAGEQVQAEIELLMQERAELMDQLSAINTEWSAAYSVRYATLAQVQARLSPDELLVYSVAGTQANDIYLMFVQRSGMSIQHLAEGHLQLNAALLNLGDAIALGDNRFQTQSLEHIKKVLALHSWPKAKKVYVVPNKQLHFVPWSAIGLGQWVSVLPNGSWLLRQGRKPASAPTYLVLGDPDFAGELPQLPGARVEAKQVSQLHRVQPLMGKQATAAELRKRSQKKLSVLHLATHGVFDYRNPLKSALYFSDDSGRSGAQAMTAEDVFNQPVRADLVVMSACETGVGQVLEDNDILGLQRSFYMNGANQIVNTLWPVSDQGTQQFMAVFHSSLDQGTGVALSRAVQASKKAGHPPAVYAAFVLNGYTQHSVAP